MNILFFLACVISAVLAENTVSYEGFKVYHVYPNTKQQVNLLNNFQNKEYFDFWTDLRQEGLTTDIMVAPVAQKSFEKFLKQNDIHHEIMFENVERAIQEERRMLLASSTKHISNRINFEEYFRHDEINSYLRDLAKTYPNLVSTELVGRSYENKELLAVKISSGGNGTKPAILIDGGIHAREWIAPATVLYIIDQLVNKTNSNLTKNVDWYILPVLNPDGYEYSHKTDRMWRKTRSPGKTCIGTDANRNFDFYWGTIGASSNECDGTYKGLKPFSEIEAVSIANYTQKYEKTVKLCLSFHSYGELLLYPWGYKDSPAENGAELQKVGDSAKDAIYAVNGTLYKVGYSYKAIYPTSGSSIDWVAGVPKIPLAYTVELPSHGHGFVLPPSHIYGVVVETFAGVRKFAEYVDSKYGKQ